MTKVKECKVVRVRLKTQLKDGKWSDWYTLTKHSDGWFK